MPKLPHEHVSEIAKMLYEWSPNETLLADNCYATYALDVYGLLRSGQDVQRVASRLGQIRIAGIGLPPDPESDQERARQLVQWWREQSPRD